MRLVFCLLLASCKQWTVGDTALQAAVVTTTAVDWHQTTEITYSCREINPIIGRCGDTVAPNVYFPVVLAAQLAIASALPKPYRGLFQAFVIGLETATIFMNARNGH